MVARRSTKSQKKKTKDTVGRVLFLEVDHVLLLGLRHQLQLLLGLELEAQDQRRAQQAQHHLQVRRPAVGKNRIFLTK